MADTFPRTQHWTIGGFRITVMLYKTHTGPCAICGKRPARHAVWADGRSARPGFGASPVDFCDDHRPAKGALPPLEYVRLIAGGEAVVAYERTEPWPDAACAICGLPAVLRYEHQCRGCDGPGQRYTTTQLLPAADGKTWAEDLPQGHHLPHTASTEYRCLAHPVTPAADWKMADA